MNGLLQEIRYALRQLRKSPSFTIVAIVTLALAIGANAVVFGVMDALLLRPLKVPDAESLYGTEYGVDTGFQSYPNYVDLRERNHSFKDLAAFSFAFVNFDAGNDPSRATGFAGTGNYFDVLKIRPYLGRFFHSSDERGNNSAFYVVLSYAYWHSRFRDDPAAVGRTVLINKRPFTIIGVAPPEFRGTLAFVSVDFFIPIVSQVGADGHSNLDERGNTNVLFEAFGHLKPGVTPEQALSDLKATGAYLEKTYPKEFSQKEYALGHLGLTSFGKAVKAFLTGLMLLAGLILLAACANLGGLFAARAADRSREVALRLALGSNRMGILRQLFTEAALISLVGASAGLAGSIALLRWLSNWQPFPAAPVHVPVSVDAKIYVVALLLALLSALLFGIVPVRQVLRANPYEIVKAGPIGRVGRRITVRDALLVAQIAICAVLVTSSMVAVRGLIRSLHSRFGFVTQNTLLIATDLESAGYGGDKVLPMQERMVRSLEAVPGVEAVGYVNKYPPLAYAAGSRVNVFGEDVRDFKASNAAAAPYRYDVSPRYFQAAGTSLLAGRDFNWHDDKNAPVVAIVNQEFAAKLFGSITNAIGRYFSLQDGKRVQVVGVIENGKYMALTEDQEPAIFLPALQSPASLSYLVIRSRRDTAELSAAIRSKFRDLDSGLPVDIETWRSLLDVALFPARMAMAALGVLGAMAGVLSITGIFGMAAYSVSKRLRELGIRLALGADRKEVLWSALGRAVRLLALGSAVGIALGIAAGRVLAHVVYQATPRDPLVLAAVVFAMSLLGLVATLVPAQRALSINPSTLLREE